MSESTYKETALFGGAITAELPADFDDASSFRQVPDNQEVYLARSGLTSLIVEITERVQPPEHPCTTDEEALLYHYQDLVASGYGRDKAEDEIKEDSKIWDKHRTKVESLGPGVPVYTLFGTQRPETQDTSQRSKPQPDFVGIIFTMIRLQTQLADILVSINVPHVPGEYDGSDIAFEEGKTGELLGKAGEYMERVLQSFRIQDWGLFVSADE